MVYQVVHMFDDSWHTLCFRLSIFTELHCWKTHCVWLTDGEIKVLYDCKQFDEPDHLGAARIELFHKRELVQEYLDKMKYIPHIKRTVTMEPSAEIQLQDK